MILKKITLDNFRQFYGIQTIEFSNESNNNITVIKGENGCGKTGIYRAMIFCLYGEKSLSNEKKSQNNGESEKVHLINFNYLEENKDKVVSASVTLEMTNDRKTYIIKRKIDGKKNSFNDEIKENDELEVEMQIIDETGNFSPYTINDKNQVKKIVNDILDSGLKDFFFFDGEQIESLSKTDKDMREAIKNGITKLLQIDNLDKAIKIVESSLQNQQKMIKNSNPTSELSQTLEDIENFKERINGKQAELDTLNEQIASANEDINGLEEKLQKNQNIKLIFEKINNKEELRTAKKENLQYNRNALQEILQNEASNIVLDAYIINANGILSNSISTNSMIIAEDKLDEMLLEKKCLCCGRNFYENDIAHTYISQLKILQEKNSGQKELVDIASRLKSKFNKREIAISKIKDYIDTIEANKSSIENITKELQELNSEVSSSSMKQEDLAGFQKAKANREKDREKYKELRAVVDSELTRLLGSLEEKQVKVKELKKASESQNNEIRKYEYLEDLYNLFDSIRQKYSLKMREKLSHEATETFRELISNKDKNLISKIEIGEKYEIIVKGWDNTSILQDISSGQRQIVSLAVIVGLAEIACNNKINIPLFMDTPFGRVSGENRSKIINSLSKKVGQWILLVTDTEMTKFEYDELIKTNKWGKMYILSDGEQKGKTKLTSIDKYLYEPQKGSVGDNNA